MNEEEKRALVKILFALLIILVLIGWSYLKNPEREKQQLTPAGFALIESSAINAEDSQQFKNLLESTPIVDKNILKFIEEVQNGTDSLVPKTYFLNQH